MIEKHNLICQFSSLSDIPLFTLIIGVSDTWDMVKQADIDELWSILVKF